MILKAIIVFLVLGLASARPPSTKDDKQHVSRQSRQYNDEQHVSKQSRESNDEQHVSRQSRQSNDEQYVSTQSRQSNDEQYTNDNYFSRGNYEDSRNARISQYDYDNNGVGTYNYNVTQTDGIYNEQYGSIENEGTDEESSRVVGYFAYPGPDGVFYYTEYIADKDGFRVAGNHIPPAANVRKVGQLGIPSAAIASLAGGGLG